MARGMSIVIPVLNGGFEQSENLLKMNVAEAERVEQRNHWHVFNAQCGKAFCSVVLFQQVR